MKDIFNKRQRFSIRKFSFGVASVLIGVSLFAPTQGVLASTENNKTGIEVNSENDNSLPTVEIKEEVQNISEHRDNASSEIDAKELSTVATSTTILDTSGDKETVNSTATTLVAGEDRSSAPEVRAASNPSELKKYELTDEYANQIKAGIIGSEGDQLDSLLVNGPKLNPEGYTDDDYLKDKEEVYIYEKNGKKYVGYNSHPLLDDTDGDGIIDSNEKPDEKLKWNVSERDMIMFMELAYRDDKYIDRVLDHKTPLTEAELYKKNGESKPRYEYMMMNRELGPYWERKKSYHTSSGLDAVLFETKSDFLYLPNGTAQVLAFRGTSDSKDIGADITLGTGSNPKQAIEAEEIMRELAKDKSITNLYLTGHSLGGYLVQRAMVEAYQLAYSDSRVMSPKEQLDYRNFYNNILKKGTTFNAPKVRTGLFSSSEFWQKGLDSKKIAKSGKLTHYIVDNDSTIGKSVSNDSDVVINVGRTSRGHSSRSYFEADMINRRPEFISGKRISLDGIGYQDKKITTDRSVEKVGETVVYSKRGDDIIKSTTVSIKDPDTGQITKNALDQVFKENGAKDKVETTEIPSPKKYVKDDTREKGQANVEVPGKTGKQTVTTTYSVNPNTGDLIEHVGQPVVKQPAIETVVKVAAKDEVEYIKRGADVVKKTTSYTVNSKTGSLTSTEKQEVVNRGGAKDIVEYNSVEPKTVYLKDENSPKGTDTVQFSGKSGQTKVTTTYSVDPVNGTLTPSKGKPEVVTIPIARVVKVGAKDKVETTEIPSPKKYVKDDTRDKGQDNVEEAGQAGSSTVTTTYEVNPSDGTITERVGKPVVVNPTETIVKVPAKDKVVETSIEPEVEYVRAGEREVGTPDDRVEGAKGKIVTTTTYDVDSHDGHITEHVGTPVVTPAGKIIVKVGAKTKVEQSKDSEGRDVIDTTTYEVDPKTGKVTPTTVRTYGKTKEPTVDKRVVPSPVVYEKDDTKEKGTAPTTVKGEDGEDTITTIYTVDPNTGKIIVSEGKPVRTKEPTNTVVKVAAKDRVVETPIEPEVEYVRDGERDVDTSNERIEGAKGKIVTTTTYDVDSNDGHITEHVDTPVVTPAGKTIVKVGAKTKVEQSKDSEGRDVIDTTTYEVDSKTGKVTPTTVRTYGKTKAPTVEKRVVPSPVVYEKDDTKEKGTAPTTVKGEDGEDTITTIYTVDPKTGKITASEGKPVRTKAPTNTIVKVAAKDKVETTEIPSPKKYVKDDTREKGQDNVEEAGQAGSSTTTTTYSVDPTTGAITETVGKPVVVNPTETIVKVAAKDKVVETPIEPEVEYVKDVEKNFGTPDQRIEGKKGKTVTTTTYDVDPTDGHITEHVGNPVVSPAGKTIVKVGAKTKVEQSKDSEGRDVIDTTTYEVDSKTGKVTPTTVRTYGKTKAPTVEKRVVPSPVVYEKDDTKEKGTVPTTVKGEDGEDTITTIYTVDPNTGKITASEGQPVRTKEPTNTVVKVAAKDKVVEIPIEPEVEYVRDGEREVDTPNERVEGAKGKTVTTTTYDVDSNDGHITEHVGNPVVTPAGKTIVKVGAKTKVEQSKDSEGHDVIDTTTYEVDPKTGKVTPTTVRTYGKTKEPKVELEQDPKTGDVTVTPKKPDGSTYPPGTKVEISGKDGNPIVVTIDEDGKGKVPNSDLPNVEKTGTGKITEPGKSSVEVPKVTTFENDALSGSIALPELMIEVRWIDEDGNVLKPSVKTGNEKDAEHGSIPVYEFVRTVIDENEPVITHIFRKVSGNTNPNTIPVTPVTPVTPATNGGSGQDTPAPSPTTPTPDAVTPNANHGSITTTIDKESKSNDSQNVLPRLGTESSMTLASLGLLGMLSSLGLAFGKKKED